MHKLTMTLQIVIQNRHKILYIKLSFYTLPRNLPFKYLFPFPGSMTMSGISLRISSLLNALDILLLQGAGYTDDINV